MVYRMCIKVCFHDPEIVFYALYESSYKNPKLNEVS